MQDFIIETISQYGYIGIFLLITIENIFPPIPSEIILLFGGFMTTFSRMNVWGVIISATMGSLLGAIIIYTIGLKLNMARINRLYGSRIGRLLRFKKEDLRKAERWFARHGNMAVFFCRFIPIVRSIISLPAGLSGMKFSEFIVLTFMGTFIWNMVLVYLGRFAGDAWEKIVVYFDLYSLIVLVSLALIALGLGFVYLKKRIFR